MEMNVKYPLSASLIVILLFFSWQAGAASLGIWPINPRIDANESATAIWIKNNDSGPVMLQIRVMDWQQNNDQDEILEQQDLVASPPMIRVNPGDQQMIRIVHRHGNIPENTIERSHRIFVDEVPDSRREGSNDASLKLHMRYSLPLFSGVKSKGKNIPHFLKNNPSLLTYRVTGNQKKYLEVDNKTSFHARLSRVKAIRSSGEAITLSDGLLGYVLPGKRMRWELSDQQAGFVQAAETRLQFIQDHTEIYVAKVSP